MKAIIVGQGPVELSALQVKEILMDPAATIIVAPAPIEVLPLPYILKEVPFRCVNLPRVKGHVRPYKYHK